MLSQKDLDDFILNNFEFVESLVKVFGSHKPINKAQQKSSLDDSHEDEEEDHFAQFKLIENELREFSENIMQSEAYQNQIGSI